MLDWKYMNNSQTAPTAGMTSATLTFTMSQPANTYHFRFFCCGNPNLLATSNNVTVTTSATPTPTPTPTPSPTACSQYTPSTTIPTGFVSPYDVVSSPSTNLIQTTCTTNSVTVNLGKGDPLQYIYNTGYLYKTGQITWSPVPYTSPESLIANAWYPKSASATISMTSAELQNPSYVLGYLCTWTGSAWKCGCRDAACT
ncbi:MAG: hypothetical protein M3N43_07935, partial [Actinomycetota bacterium]|nr:hypothetical protein [Actinomycetota bacterium]